MKVWIVKFRRSGDDYEVRLFRNKEEAESLALDFLKGCVWSPEDFDTLDELEAHCADNDLAYIDITYDII